MWFYVKSLFLSSSKSLFFVANVKKYSKLSDIISIHLLLHFLQFLSKSHVILLQEVFFFLKVFVSLSEVTCPYIAKSFVHSFSLVFHLFQLLFFSLRYPIHLNLFCSRSTNLDRKTVHEKLCVQSHLFWDHLSFYGLHSTFLQQYMDSVRHVKHLHHSTLYIQSLTIFAT